jgi:hypothetical protein
VPAQKRLGLDEHEHLLPVGSTGHEEHQEESIKAAERWTVDLSLKHDELLAQESIFSDQLGLSPGKIARETADGAVSRWGGPGDEARLEQMTGGAHDPVAAMGKTDQHRGYVLHARIGRSVQRSRGV